MIRTLDEKLTIKCLDGAEIITSKVLLCRYSEVFSKMFENKASKENKEGAINIDDAEPRALNQFITFLTTCKIPCDATDQDLLDLLILGDKYMVKKLKEDSTNALTLKTDLDILPKVLLASSLCNAKKLYIVSVRRASEDIQACRAAPGWKEISQNPDILGDLLTYLANLNVAARFKQLETSDTK